MQIRLTQENSRKEERDSAGPAEYSAQGWNRTWFYPEPAAYQVPGSKSHGIYATSWRPTQDGYFPLTWSPNVTYIHGIDVTDRYVANQAKAH